MDNQQQLEMDQATVLSLKKLWRQKRYDTAAERFLQFLGSRTGSDVNQDALWEIIMGVALTVRSAKAFVEGLDAEILKDEDVGPTLVKMGEPVIDVKAFPCSTNPLPFRQGAPRAHWPYLGPKGSYIN